MFFRLLIAVTAIYGLTCSGAASPPKVKDKTPWSRNPLHNGLLPRAESDPSAFCPAASWPHGAGNPGLTVQSQVPDPELQAALAEIDANKIKAYIAKLVSFGTRSTISNQTDPSRGVGAARDWVASTMRSFAVRSDGRMRVTTPSYIQGVAERIPFPTRITDIVATLQGSETPERYYLVSGHYDTRVSDPNNGVDDAPGADDDGSGVAVSLELARVMATRRPRSTLVFVAVAGEEQGLYGSNFLAETYANQSVNIAGMLDNDIVGSSTGDDGTKEPHTLRLFAAGAPTDIEAAAANAPIASSWIRVGGENDSPARELGRFAVSVAQNKYTGIDTLALEYRQDRFLRSGDHISFLESGFLSSVRFTEPNENFAHQHQDVRVQDGKQYGDLEEFLDYDFIKRVGAVNLATMWSLSEAPSTPTDVFVNTTELSNDSSFVWKDTTAQEPGLDGYELVWRPTDAPFWQYAIPVGMGEVQGPNRTATVNLSKDNVIFGLRAVGKNGYRSPAAFALFPL